MSPAPPLLAALLDLDPDRTLLTRWYGREAPASEIVRHLQASALAELHRDPARCLAAVEHVLRSAAGADLDALDRARMERLHAHALRQTGQVTQAARVYARAAKQFERRGATEELARTTIGWVFALALAGNLSECRRVERLGARLLGSKHAVLRARLRANLGLAYMELARWEPALDLYRQARSQFRRAKDDYGVALCMVNLGNLERRRGRLARARASYESARKVFESLDQPLSLLYVRHDLACVTFLEGDVDSAISEMEALQEEFSRRGDRQYAAESARELAELSFSVGLFDRARQAAARAHEEFGALGLATKRAKSGSLYGRILLERDRRRDARLVLQEALEHWKDIEAVRPRLRVELDLAVLARLDGDLTQAARALRSVTRRADALDPRGLGSACRWQMALVDLERGRTASALARAKEAHAAARRYPASLLRPWVGMTVARILSARGEHGHALRWARKAVRDFERQALRLGRRQLRNELAGRRQDLARDAISVALARADRIGDRAALELASLARSPGLIEDLLQGRDWPGSSELRQQLTVLRDRLLADELGPEGDVRFRAVRSSFERVERKLLSAPRRLPQHVRQAYEMRHLKRWIQHLAGRDLVMFQQSHEGWLAFVVSEGKGVRVVRLPEARVALRESWLPLRMTLEALAHSPAEHRDELLGRTLQESVATLAQLRGALWDPLGPLGKNVVVVTDGVLHGLPFEAVAESSAPAEATAPNVVRLPHPALLGHRPRGRSGRALLLRGDVPGADDEIDRIGSLLRRAGYQTEVGQSRRDLECRATPVDVLHVAAHGNFHRRSWIASGIRLKDDWIGFEHLDPRWIKNGLIFFDSCESGLAMDMPGAEMDGWLSAGLGAGARELVLTLWKLDEASAVSFSETFYEEWIRTGRASVASRRARAMLRARRPHPFAWAPFVAVGP